MSKWTSYKWDYLTEHEKSVNILKKFKNKSICCKREKKIQKTKNSNPKMEPNHETKMGHSK